MRRTAMLTRLPALVLLFTLVLTGTAVPPLARANSVYQSLPFSQDWSNAALITTDNNWDGVPGIVGYLGDGLVSTTSADPQTILADGSLTTSDVNANETNPNTFDTGGVAEFDSLANATVALQGSSEADAPHLVLYLNTTGQQNINIQYKVRDLDGSTDNAVQQVALHYRVGTTGNFTNVPGAGFVLDATTGPSLATQVISVNAPLPAAANNQSQLQVRIMTANASGNDEWVGIDDISVTALSVGDPAPQITGVTPLAGSSALPDNNLTINFDEAVTAEADAVTLSCNGSPVSLAGLPVGAPGVTQLVLNPSVNLPFDASCTFTVMAAKVADVDGTPNTLVSNQSFNFTVLPSQCAAGATLTKISAVQGSGTATPLPTTQDITLEGVVSGLFAGLSGFYLQEEPADYDADAATSEGVFVSTGGGGFPVSLAVGDTVRVTGRPGESTTGATSQTQINGPSVVDCGTGGTAASPVDLTLPLAATGDQERYEGMLVRLPQTLTISEYFNFDRFGEYALALPLPGEPRLFQGTAVVEPGAAAIARAAQNLLRRIIVDDGRTSFNPDPAIHPNGQPFTLQNRFRGGDTVAGLQGILSQQFGTYRIQPTLPGTYAAVNQRPTAPEVVNGTLRVGAMNALNFFLTLNDGTLLCGPAGSKKECRGADSNQPQEFTRQRAKLLAAIQLLNPDVLGLIELENTTDVDPLANIVEGLNAALGANTYAAISTGVIGTDAIRVGFIYKPAKATPVGAFKLLTSAEDARFIDTKNRPVLAQTFLEVASGEKLTLAVGHLKSKGSACDDVGDQDANDGQGNCNGTRRDAARALVDWLATDPTSSGDPDFLIVGDLNSYAKEDPIDAILVGADDAPGSADDYTNLIAQFQGALAYSYLFDSQVGYLDHALASAGLLPQVEGASELHINADEPDLLDYDTSFKKPAQVLLYEPNAYRASDHDPVLVGIDLGVDDPDPLVARLWLPLLRR